MNLLIPQSILIQIKPSKKQYLRFYKKSKSENVRTYESRLQVLSAFKGLRTQLNATHTAGDVSPHVARSILFISSSSFLAPIFKFINYADCIWLDCRHWATNVNVHSANLRCGKLGKQPEVPICVCACWEIKLITQEKYFFAFLLIVNAKILRQCLNTLIFVSFNISV